MLVERPGRAHEVQCEATVKTILRLEEEDDEGVTTIREKEQFSHYLNLLYCTGETAVLTSDPPAEDEHSNEKAAATSGNADAAPVEARPSVGRM